MKKILTVILFCFFLLPTMANAESLYYTNQENHYSFTVPNGWVTIPKPTIDEAFQMMADQAGGQFIDYATGFQLENTPDFQYPYILVQEHKTNTPSYNQIVGTFESDKFSESMNKEINKYSDKVSNATLQEPFIDKERSIIFMNLEMDAGDIGKIKGLMALFLGKESIIQVNFYSLESEYSENLSTFSQVIDSFKYEQGYEYTEEEAKKNDPPSIFEGTTRKFLVNGAAGLVVLMILGLFQYMKKKK